MLVLSSLIFLPVVLAVQVSLLLVLISLTYITLVLCRKFGKTLYNQLTFPPFFSPTLGAAICPSFRRTSGGVVQLCWVQQR
jgi:hypothetical protein